MPKMVENTVGSEALAPKQPLRRVLAACWRSGIIWNLRSRQDAEPATQ